MSQHPINLFIRFALEMFLLVASGMWGYHLAEGWASLFPALGIPLLLSTIWGVFNVPHDASRSGSAPVKTPGLIRLILELSMLGFGCWCLYDLGHRTLGMTMAAFVLLHYIASYDRVKWLLNSGK